MTATSTPVHDESELSIRGSERSVLVAEENHEARVFLADNLTCDGYNVWTADSREQALAILAVEHLVQRPISLL